MLPPSPLRPAERSILFSETSVRLSDDVRSTASLHAPKKGCAVREVRAANLHVGVAFLIFGEAKKGKCPAGTKRMVKATPQANHNVPTIFQAAYPPTPNPKELPAPILHPANTQAPAFALRCAPFLQTN